MSDMGGYGWIAETVSMGVADVSGVIQSYHEGIASDPCQEVISVSVQLMAFEERLRDYDGYIAEGAEAIAQARLANLQWWGEDNPLGPAGTFVDYLWDGGAAPPNEEDHAAWTAFLALWTLGLGGLFLGAGSAEEWSQRLYSALPAGGARPPGQNRGLMLSPGIYLWAGSNASDDEHLANGNLTGWKVRDLYDAWVAIIGNSVGPSNWPNWATDMAYMVGDSSWQVGDPIVGGYMGTYVDQLDEMRGYLASRMAACDAQRAVAQGLAISEQLADEYGEAEALEIERERQRLFMIGLVVVAALKFGFKGK